MRNAVEFRYWGEFSKSSRDVASLHPRACRSVAHPSSLMALPGATVLVGCPCGSFGDDRTDDDLLRALPPSSVTVPSAAGLAAPVSCFPTTGPSGNCCERLLPDLGGPLCLPAGNPSPANIALWCHCAAPQMSHNRMSCESSTCESERRRRTGSRVDQNAGSCSAQEGFSAARRAVP